jgi:hypothetical protein
MHGPGIAHHQSRAEFINHRLSVVRVGALGRLKAHRRDRPLRSSTQHFVQSDEVA